MELGEMGAAQLVPVRGDSHPAHFEMDHGIGHISKVPVASGHQFLVQTHLGTETRKLRPANSLH
jgi:hypothetical protein